MNLSERIQGYADSPHPSLEHLNAFAVGQLAEDTWVEVERHLAVCPGCNRLLETSPNDSFVALLQQGDSLVLSGPSSAVVPSRSLRIVPGYQMLEMLGEGGMGVVWKAKQEGLNRLVALKRIRGTQASAETLARFRREAEAVARLQHPNIVQIYDVGEQDDEPYLALEYVDGGSLADRLTAGPLLFLQAAGLIETLARAIQHAHENGIIHRDLKPANVLLGEDGAAKITDFGLAKRLDEEVGQTQTGAILGTPSYMAPEQTSGVTSSVGPLADVYALGAIFYETLTGRPPFRGPSLLDTLAQVREREPVPPRQLQPNVPGDLQTICLKCLHKEPRRRYGSALELADDLRRFLDGEPIRARPVGRLERLLKWMRRKPYHAVLAIVLALIPVAVVAGLLGHNERLRKEVLRAETAERTDRENYSKSRQAILHMLARLDDWKKGGAKETSKLHLGLVEEALAYVQTVLDNGERSDPGVRADAAALLLQIARNQGYHSRGQEARANFTRALHLYEQLAGEQPEVLSHRDGALQCYMGLTVLADDPAQQLAWSERAVTLSEELCRLEPEDDFHRPTDLAQSHHNLACQFQSRHRLAEAEEHYREAIRLMAQVSDPHPKQLACKLGLAESYANLGLLYHATHRAESAENAFQRADGFLARLSSDGTIGFSAMASRSSVALNWGNLYLERGQIDKALSSYDRGLQWSEEVLRREPTHTPARAIVLKLHGSKAVVYEARQRFAKAATEWDRVIELAEGDERRQYRLRGAVARARAGDSTRAATEADALAAEKDCSPDVLYNLACVFSLAKQADKAIALLSKLQSSGYFDKAENLKTLQTDTDLDSLRKRDDFLKPIDRSKAKRAGPEA